VRGVSAAMPLVNRFVKASHTILADCQAKRSSCALDTVAYTQRSNCSVPHKIAPESIETSATRVTGPVPAEVKADAVLRAAFRDLHGSRLHGFALLVALGDRGAAAGAAADAMSAAASRIAELRHPERAAAWLRARVVESLATSGRTRAAETERRAALRALGVAGPAFDGLAALSVVERAALVSSSIERLDPIDVEQVLGRSMSDVRRLLERSRSRYLTAARAAMARESPTSPADPAPPGELATRVEAVAARTIGPGWSAR
jgi:hypothetical protein